MNKRRNYQKLVVQVGFVCIVKKRFVLPKREYGRRGTERIYQDVFFTGRLILTNEKGKVTPALY